MFLLGFDLVVNLCGQHKWWAPLTVLSSLWVVKVKSVFSPFYLEWCLTVMDAYLAAAV
jgi:hypothetical protein